MSDTGNNRNTTFAFLKPQVGNKDHTDAIIDRLVQAGFHVVKRKIIDLTPELLAEHYAEHVGKAFYQPMVDYLVSGLITLLALRREDGQDPVQTLRDLCGPTDPKKGKPGQIRYDFGVHDPSVIFKNAIHASGSPEEAAIELRRFFG